MNSELITAAAVEEDRFDSRLKAFKAIWGGLEPDTHCFEKWLDVDSLLLKRSFSGSCDCVVGSFHPGIWTLDFTDIYVYIYLNTSL